MTPEKLLGCFGTCEVLTGCGHYRVVRDAADSVTAYQRYFGCDQGASASLPAPVLAESPLELQVEASTGDFWHSKAATYLTSVYEHCTSSATAASEASGEACKKAVNCFDKLQEAQESCGVIWLPTMTVTEVSKYVCSGSICHGHALHLQENCSHYHRVNAVLRPVTFYQEKYCPSWEQDKTHYRDPDLVNDLYLCTIRKHKRESPLCTTVIQCNEQISAVDRQCSGNAGTTEETMDLVGPYKGLPMYEENIQQIAARNGRTNIVARVVMTDFDGRAGTVCKSIIHGQTFHLQSVIEKDTVEVTVLNGRVSYYRGPVIIVDDQSVLLQHKVRDSQDLLKLVEVCSGLGGIGMGAKAAGWQVLAQNELMHSFCEHQKQFSSIPVVEGSVCKMSTVAALHHLAPDAGCLAMGFSCQPFSRGGDGQQGLDERAATLPFGLYIGYLLRKQVIVLECVAEAASSPFVQRCLQYHESQVPGDRSETLLELSDVWPSKRRRWWTVITQGHFGRVPLSPLPKLPQMPTISSLFSDFLQLPDQELQQLLLSETERAAFHNYGKGIISQMVDKTGPLNTALHSWGNQCQPCSCGCRGPFSHQRLQDRGLFGALVHVAGQAPHQNLRHISPKEMAILCGAPMEEGWESPQRLLMAGIGQIASPIQAVWIFSHIRAHLGDMRYGDIAVHKPRHILACLCMDLFKLRDQWFGSYSSVPMNLFQESIEELLTPEKLALDEFSKSSEPVTEAPGASSFAGSIEDDNAKEHAVTAATAFDPFASSTPAESEASEAGHIRASEPVHTAHVVTPCKASEAGFSVPQIPALPEKLNTDVSLNPFAGRHPCPALPLFQAKPGDFQHPAGPSPQEMRKSLSSGDTSHTDLAREHMPGDPNLVGTSLVSAATESTTKLHGHHARLIDDSQPKVAVEISQAFQPSSEIPDRVMPLDAPPTRFQAKPLQQVQAVGGPSHVKCNAHEVKNRGSVGLEEVARTFSESGPLPEEHHCDLASGSVHHDKSVAFPPPSNLAQ
eukprot:s3111_g3.t2